MAGFKPELWAMLILGMLKQRKKLIDLGDRQFDSLVKNGGSSLHLPVMGAVNVQDETAAGNYTVTTPDNEVDSGLNLDRRAVVTVGIGVVDQTQANQSLMNKYSEQAAKKTARALDLRFAQTAILGADAANKKAYGEFSAAATRITKSVIGGAQEIMNNADIDMEDRVLVVDAKGYKDLLDIPDFVDYNKIAYAALNSPLATGVIGKVMGFDVFMLPSLPKIKDDYTLTDGTKSCSVFFQKDAISTVIQAELIARSTYDTKVGQDVLQLFTIYGQKVFVPGSVIVAKENAS